MLLVTRSCSEGLGLQLPLPLLTRTPRKLSMFL